MEIHPEPQGYRCYPGFVKSRPENNKAYLEFFEEDPWYPAILRADVALNRIIPGYNIAPIKEKFGRLRYYIDYPDGITETQIIEANAVIRGAEAWVDGYEAAKEKYDKEVHGKEPGDFKWN